MTARRGAGSSGRSPRGGRGEGDNGGGNGGDPRAETRSGPGEPDVLLDVPKLGVEEISLEVDNLHARIALEARLADLVQLYVGADVDIERVALEIKGVEAQAQLKARLDNVLAIVQRALDTVDQHPEILTDLSRTARQAVAEIGDGAGQLAEGVAQTGGQLAEGVAQTGGQLAEGVGQAGQLAEGVAGAAGSSEPEGERRRANRRGSQAGSRRRKAGSSAS